MERKTVDKATGQSREIVKTDEELAKEEAEAKAKEAPADTKAPE